MINKVILIGKIGLDPEIRYLKDGEVLTIIKLVTEDYYEKLKNIQWHRVIIKGKIQSLQKNMLVLIEGKIKTRRWLDKIKYNYITEIIAENFEILKFKTTNDGNIENNYDNNIENSNKNILKEKNINFKNMSNLIEMNNLEVQSSSSDYEKENNMTDLYEKSLSENSYNFKTEQDISSN